MLLTGGRSQSEGAHCWSTTLPGEVTQAVLGPGAWRRAVVLPFTGCSFCCPDRSPLQILPALPHCNGEMPRLTWVLGPCPVAMSPLGRWLNCASLSFLICKWECNSDFQRSTESLPHAGTCIGQWAPRVRSRGASPAKAVGKPTAAAPRTGAMHLPCHPPCAGAVSGLRAPADHVRLSLPPGSCRPAGETVETVRGW